MAPYTTTMAVFAQKSIAYVFKVRHHLTSIPVTNLGLDVIMRSVNALLGGCLVLSHLDDRGGPRAESVLWLSGHASIPALVDELVALSRYGAGNEWWIESQAVAILSLLILDKDGGLSSNTALVDFVVQDYGAAIKRTMLEMYTKSSRSELRTKLGRQTLETLNVWSCMCSAATHTQQLHLPMRLIDEGALFSIEWCHMVANNQLDQRLPALKVVQGML